jgi:hypothetical protein
MMETLGSVIEVNKHVCAVGDNEVIQYIMILQTVCKIAQLKEQEILSSQNKEKGLQK